MSCFCANRLQDTVIIWVSKTEHTITVSNGLTLSDFFSGLSMLLAAEEVAFGCLNEDCDGVGPTAPAFKSSSC